MRKIRSFIWLAVLWLLSSSVFAQSNQTVSIIENYKDWKWDSVYVAKNKYISLAVVPDAAGRILEYNLGEVPSLWLNPDMFGKSFALTDEVKRNEWRNFGGYRLVPIPINNCSIDKNRNKANRWPPPAIIGDAPYTVEISKDENGTQSIDVASGIQELPVPFFDGKSKEFIYPEKVDEVIQYKRSVRIEQNSSLVYIKHSVLNKGNEAIKRGIMTTSQHVSQSTPEIKDGENFLAYIPFDEKLKLPDGHQYEITCTPESRWRYVSRNRFPLDKNNPEHVEKYFNNGTNWTGEVAPGIFEIHYDYDLMSGFHIISSKSWIAYVNKLNKTAFIKLFEPYDAHLEYEYGVNVSVFSSGMSSGYLETEVKTPIYTIAPGKCFDYHEIHAAAKVATLPLLDVNKTGVITQRLNFDVRTKTITGKYGVFKEGKSILRLLDKSDNLIEEIALEAVNPLQAFKLEYNVKKTSEIATIELFVREGTQEFLLDIYKER